MKLVDAPARPSHPLQPPLLLQTDIKDTPPDALRPFPEPRAALQPKPWERAGGSPAPSIPWGPSATAPLPATASSPAATPPWAYAGAAAHAGRAQTDSVGVAAPHVAFAQTHSMGSWGSGQAAGERGDMERGGGFNSSKAPTPEPHGAHEPPSVAAEPVSDSGAPPSGAKHGAQNGVEKLGAHGPLNPDASPWAPPWRPLPQAPPGSLGAFAQNAAGPSGAPSFAQITSGTSHAPHPGSSGVQWSSGEGQGSTQIPPAAGGQAQAGGGQRSEGGAQGWDSQGAIRRGLGAPPMHPPLSVLQPNLAWKPPQPPLPTLQPKPGGEHVGQPGGDAEGTQGLPEAATGGLMVPAEGAEAQ